MVPICSKGTEVRQSPLSDTWDRNRHSLSLWRKEKTLREGRFLNFSPQELKGVKLWHWEQARYPWLLLMRLCQAMEQQTRQRCLNLDISRSVSEEIRSPGQASQGQDRGEPGLEALFLRPSPAASDKGAARPGAPGAA